MRGGRLIEPGKKWECTQCGNGGTVSRMQEEDLAAMGSARCPYCYCAVIIKRGMGG